MEENYNFSHSIWEKKKKPNPVKFNEIITTSSRSRPLKAISFPLRAFLLQQKKGFCAESHVWLTPLSSWCLHCCIHLAPMTVTCHPDAARLKGDVRQTRQMTTSSSSRASAGWSVTWWWATACHLFTYSFNVGKMSRGGRGWGRWQEAKREWVVIGKKALTELFLISKYQQEPFCTSQWARYISMGTPAEEPIINSILGKKSDLQNRNCSHLVWGAWGRQTVHLALDYMKYSEFLAHLISAVVSDAFLASTFSF